MRFLFKTDYEDDIRLMPHSGYLVTYGVLLALLAIAPFVLSSYIMSQLVFVCIYATVGVGLMILTGFTGQASLGHAAFLAIGAYTAAFLQQYNVPFPVYFLAAGLLTGVVGALVGFPALRLQGIYLVIATISFAFIVEEILARWESVTHGNEGMRVKTMQVFGMAISRDSPTFSCIRAEVTFSTSKVAHNRDTVGLFRGNSTTACDASVACPLRQWRRLMTKPKSAEWPSAR